MQVCICQWKEIFILAPCMPESLDSERVDKEDYRQSLFFINQTGYGLSDKRCNSICGLTLAFSAIDITFS